MSISTNLLKYFTDLRENFDNVKNIEGFVADPFWGDTDYIPDSFKDGDRIVNPCLKYDPDRVNQLDQECVKEIMAASTSPEQTKALEKVFGIDSPATVTNTTPSPAVTTTPPSTETTSPAVTTTPPSTETTSPTVTTTSPTVTTTSPVVISVPTTLPDDTCSNNILDFQCNKNLKILIWCLIIACVFLILSFIIYVMYTSQKSGNTTVLATEMGEMIQTNTNAPQKIPSVDRVGNNNINYQNKNKQDFLTRMIGGKSRKKH
jgi:hypothetical protein